MEKRPHGNAPWVIMVVTEKRKFRHVTLHPGEYHVSNKKVVISTLLGSCISACLYDPVNGIVGMNHFLLGNRGYSKDTPICLTEAGRYGIHAMELTINGMFRLGADRNYLKAKVFGGGSFFRPPVEPDGFLCVGELNNRFIVEFLKTDGIPLVAHDLGGNRPRRIHFSSDDFSVLVRKTKTDTSVALLKTEKQLWQKSLEVDEGGAAEPDLWV